jgi:hypothetical protein
MVSFSPKVWPLQPNPFKKRHLLKACGVKMKMGKKKSVWGKKVRILF